MKRGDNTCLLSQKKADDCYFHISRTMNEPLSKSKFLGFYLSDHFLVALSSSQTMIHEDPKHSIYKWKRYPAMPPESLGSSDEIKNKLRKKLWPLEIVSRSSVRIRGFYVTIFDPSINLVTFLWSFFQYFILKSL